MTRFGAAFLDDIRSRVSISSIVGRHVAWDRRKSNPAKGDWWACCPFHSEKTASFHVEDRKGRYFCFGCKESGDVFTFLIAKEGLAFPEAVERLAQEAGLPMPQVSEADVEREKRRGSLYDVMELSAAFFEETLRSPRGAKARAYLAERGLPPDIQREFRLGYAPDDRSALRSHLAEKDVTLEQMAEAGLVIAGEDIPVAYDRFRDRVMFPIADARGRIVAFGGRALSKDAQAKYLNSPDTPLFHKGRVLYNLDKARGAAHERQSIIAVEGYMDAIAMHRAGFPNTVAPLGTALTEEQLALLWRMAPEPILCFDGDQAGIKAAYRALDLALPMLKPGHSLRFALLSEGQDPDDLLRHDGPDAVKSVVETARPLIDVLWSREAEGSPTDTPDRRASFEVRLSELIGEIGDATVRRYYAEDVRRRLAQHLAPASGAGTPFRRTARGPALARPLVKARRRRGARPEPHDFALPASAGLRASPLAGASRRQEQEGRERLILLAAINHPDLLHDFLSDFDELEMSSRELDSLRRQLIDTAALGDALDGQALRSHLHNKGFGPVLARLENQAHRLNEWFLKPGAASADARVGLRQMIALHRKSVTLERELKTAEALFAADPSEENLEALNRIRDELASHLGVESQIDGFGQASGRPVSILS
jgi:DNA primase